MCVYRCCSLNQFEVYIRVSTFRFCYFETGLYEFAGCIEKNKSQSPKDDVCRQSRSRPPSVTVTAPDHRGAAGLGPRVSESGPRKKDAVNSPIPSLCVLFPPFACLHSSCPDLSSTHPKETHMTKILGTSSWYSNAQNVWRCNIKYYHITEGGWVMTGAGGKRFYSNIFKLHHLRLATGKNCEHFPFTLRASQKVGNGPGQFVWC